MADIFEYFRSRVPGVGRAFIPAAPGRSYASRDDDDDDDRDRARDALIDQLRRQLLDPEGKDSPRPRQRNWDLKDLFGWLVERDRQAENRLAFRTGTHDAVQPQGGAAVPPMIPQAAAALPSPAALVDAATPMTPDLEGMRGAAMMRGAPALSVGGGVPMVTGINPDAPAPLQGLPADLLAASATEDPLRAALAAPQPPAPVATPAAAQEPMRPYEDRLRAALSMLPKPPELPEKSSAWDQILRFGLATAAAGERPGATLMGAVGRGGLAVMDAMEREEEKRAQIADRIYSHHVAAVQVANAMARGEGQEVLAQRDDERKDRELSQRGQIANNQLKMHYDQMVQQARENGLNRANQVYIAKLNRESASLDREAQRGSTEAIALLNAQASRDRALTDTIEKTIAAGKTGPGGIKESFTQEEAAAKRREIILNSPGTTLNEQLRTSELMSKMSQAKTAAEALRQQGRNEEADALLRRANELFERELKLIEKSRLQLRK